jgi:hypothetical protein
MKDTVFRNIFPVSAINIDLIIPFCPFPSFFAIFDELINLWIASQVFIFHTAGERYSSHE